MCNYHKGWRLLKWLINPRYMRLNLSKVYPYTLGIPTRVVGTCFCRETTGGRRHHIDLRLLICNRVNNKKVGARCRCHITFCVQNQYLWITKFPIFRNILIHRNRFYLFRKCGILRNLFSFTQRKVCFLLCRLFIKKQYYDRYYDI